MEVDQSQSHTNLRRRNPNRLSKINHKPSVDGGVLPSGRQLQKRPRSSTPSDNFAPSNSDTESSCSTVNFIPTPPRKRSKVSSSKGKARSTRTRMEHSSVHATTMETNDSNSPATAGGSRSVNTVNKNAIAPNMQSDRKVSKHPESIKIIKTASGLTYEFNGRKCQHESSSASSPTSPPTPESLLPSNGSLSEAQLPINLREEDLDNSCAGLSAYSISMCKSLNTFFCHRHMEFVSLSGISQHIRRRTGHGNTFPAGNNHVADFLKHLKSAYPSASDPPAGVRATRNVKISAPITFLPQPSRYALCPSPSCSAAFKWSTTSVNNHYRSHFTKSPACLTALTYKYRPSGKTVGAADWKAVDYNLKYAQVTGKYTDLQMVFCLPDEWTPSTGTATDAPAQPLSTHCTETKHSDPIQLYQPYVEELGWDKALPAELIDTFKSLLKMPVEDDCSQEEADLHRGLSEIHEFLYTYLQSANEFVESRCIIVRQSFTKG